MPKRVMPLTDIQAKTAKGREVDYKLTDGKGLYLLVTTSGGKLWRLDYQFDGKRKTLALGSYPEISLARAREKRDQARTQIAEGIDPGQVKAAIKTAVRASTENAFETVAREWLKRFAPAWSETYPDLLLSRLETNVFPWLGTRPVGEITAPELLAVLRRIEERGATEVAHRTRAVCGQIFRYAISTGRAERDPAADLRGALTPRRKRHFASITTPKEVAALLRTIDGFTGGPVVKTALKIGIYTFVRPGELRGMKWEELDLDAALWSIPPDRMKMKSPHLVPLATQVVELLRELQPITGHTPYVFPCQRTTTKSISENTINAGLRRMGYEKEELTGHGFRAMARTLLDEVLQFRVDWIEAQLAHLVKDPLGRAYNRTTHLEDRKRMMQTYADYLDGLRQGAKVIPFLTVA